MNIPFELIFIVLFFVLPAISSVVRRVQGRGQPRPARTRPDRPPRADTSSPSADTSTRADTNTSTDIPRWLEEAQRRVREAQQGETEQRGGRGTQATKPSTPQPQAAKPLVQPRPSATRPNQTRPATTQPKPTSLEDYRPNPVSLERTSAPTRRPATTPAPPLRVQRLGSQKSATLGSYKMRFDGETLMTGFIWHQILSPPLSKRRNTQSQRRP